MKLPIIVFLLFVLFSCEKPTPALFMIGDSTMAHKPDLDYPERGWGQLLPSFFDSTFYIENHAKNGRSTRSFIYESRWDTVYCRLKKDDYVVVQFGHNDEAESKVGRHATPDEYRYNLSKFIKEAREIGAHPILCTPIVRRNFDIDGNFIDTHGVYPDVVREVAMKLDVPLIDMHKKSEDLLIQLGEENSKPLFLQILPGIFEDVMDGKIDNTHFSEVGATTMAKLFVEGLKEQNHELSNYLKDDR